MMLCLRLEHLVEVLVEWATTTVDDGPELVPLETKPCSVDSLFHLLQYIQEQSTFLMVVTVTIERAGHVFRIMLSEQFKYRD